MKIIHCTQNDFEKGRTIEMILTYPIQFLFRYSFAISSTMMSNWFKVLSAVVIGLCAFRLRAISAKGNSSTPDDEDKDKNGYHSIELSMAWIDKPPYTTSPANGSKDNELHGMIRDALYRYISYDCGWAWKIVFLQNAVRVNSEFGMVELLRQNKVHFAAPIFEPINRQYSEFPFLKLVDYPGTEFITTEEDTNKLKVVLDTVLKSWPLFAVTLILTAIAGVIEWALVGLTWYIEINIVMLHDAN